MSVWLSGSLVDFYRDRALILGALHLRLRPGEAVSLDTRRMLEVPQGLLVDLARSKTNPEGARRETRGAVFHHDPELCGVRAILEWAELRDLAIPTPTSPAIGGGMLFGPSHPTDPHAITSASTMSQMIRRRSRVAGLKHTYSGYSLRRGAAQIMAARGATEDDIRRALGHQSIRTQNVYRSEPELRLTRSDLTRLTS